VFVGVVVGVGHNVVPFNSMLHSSQSLNILYDWNNKVVLGIALATTVQALNPSSVVNRNVF